MIPSRYLLEAVPGMTISVLEGRGLRSATTIASHHHRWQLSIGSAPLRESRPLSVRDNSRNCSSIAESRHPPRSQGHGPAQLLNL